MKTLNLTVTMELGGVRVVLRDFNFNESTNTLSHFSVFDTKGNFLGSLWRPLQDEPQERFATAYNNTDEVLHAIAPLLPMDAILELAKQYS